MDEIITAIELSFQQIHHPPLTTVQTPYGHGGRVIWFQKASKDTLS